MTWLFTEVGAVSRKTVGWLTVPAGGTCPDKGVAVKVMAPALGDCSVVSRAYSYAWFAQRDSDSYAIGRDSGVGWVIVELAFPVVENHGGVPLLVLGYALRPVGEGQCHRVRIGQGQRVFAVGCLDELGLLGLHDHEPLALWNVVLVCEGGSADEKNGKDKHADSGKEGLSFPSHSSQRRRAVCTSSDAWWRESVVSVAFRGDTKPGIYPLAVFSRRRDRDQWLGFSRRRTGPV